MLKNRIRAAIERRMDSLKEHNQNGDYTADIIDLRHLSDQIETGQEIKNHWLLGMLVDEEMYLETPE